MTAARTGRRLEPIETFEVTPWRALTVFRLATLGYAVLLTGHNFRGYLHPYAAWPVMAVMGAWSALAIVGYLRPALRAWPLLIVDVSVTAACLLATRPIVGVAPLAAGIPTLTITWMACPVLAVAVVKHVRWGIAAAILIGGCDLAARGVINQNTITGTVIMVMAAAALGYLSTIGIRAQERLRFLAAAQAAHGERDRLARGIHDSVLQVLALVQRRGEELGGEAAELGRLAGEQERNLRALVTSESRPASDGLVDLRAVVGLHAGTSVAVASPADAVWLPMAAATEVGAVVAAALENVRRHCPAQTRAWILVESESDAITVTVRDDGPGIAAGRLEQAAAQGRLGVAQSIRGRVKDLGGTVTVSSAAGTGTEIELRIPVGAARTRVGR